MAGRQLVRDIPPFSWSRLKEEAAFAVAEDILTDQEIADRAGVTRSALWKWKNHPGFLLRVDEYRTAMRDSVMRMGIAQKEHRIAGYNERRKALLRVLRERAADALRKRLEAEALERAEELEAMSDAAFVKLLEGTEAAPQKRKFRQQPGAETGLLVREFKNDRPVWCIDTALLAELRALELQAARELGQLEKDAMVSVEVKAYIGFDPDDV